MRYPRLAGLIFGVYFHPILYRSVFSIRGRPSFLGLAFVSRWDSSIRQAHAWHALGLVVAAPSEGQPRPDTLFFRTPFGF